jgi:hypothetical protein
MWSKSKIKNKKNWALLIIITSIVLLSASINLAQAQDFIKFKPQIPIPGINTEKAMSSDPATGKITSNLLGLYIKGIYDYGLSIAGILAAIVLMAGGLIWLTSAGNETKVGQAKSMIISSITGLVILFSAWIILNTVNPKLLDMQAISVVMITPKSQGFCDKEKGPTNDYVTTEDNKIINNNNQELNGAVCKSNETCFKQGSSWRCGKTVACCDLTADKPSIYYDYCYNIPNSEGTEHMLPSAAALCAENNGSILKGFTCDTSAKSRQNSKLPFLMYEAECK